MKPVPLDLLRQIDAGKLPLTGVNVWKVLRYRAHIQVIGLDGEPMDGVPRLDRVASFRLTPRGKALLQSTVTLPFYRQELPLHIAHYTSSLRRWCRNIPKGLRLAYSDGELHVVAEDLEGHVANDEAHRIASAKVPWIE